MDSQVKQVKITHIINPSCFFFREASREAEDLEQIEEIEKHVAKLAEDKAEDYIALQFYDPKPKDVVAYFHQKKWIRCVVDKNENFLTNKVLILWCLDYGVPLHTSNFSNIVPLPSALMFPEPKIYEGCLSSMPATLIFDHVCCKELTVFDEKWHDRALKMFQEFISNAQQVLFLPSIKVSHHKKLIGDLLVADQSVVNFGISLKLLEAKLAISVPDDEFLIYHEKLFTNIIERWNDNERSGGVLKLDEGFRDDFRADSNYDKVKSFDINGSLIDEDDFEFVYQKVLNWKISCDNVPEKEFVEESEVFDIPDVSSKRVPFHTVFKRPTKPKIIIHDKSSDLVPCKTVVSVERSSIRSERNRPKIKSGPTFLPAGASIQSNIEKNRKKGNQKSRAETLSMNETLDDDQFESVSQQSSHGTEIQY